jgi:taurine transport system ATP-binding protein
VVLEIERVTVEFRPKKGPPLVALREVNLTIRPGEFVVALGASGCGKTTLLNTVAGFLPPTSGQIRLAGKPVLGPGRERGVVFQQHALMPWLSVLGNVEFGLRLQGLARGERRRIALECLAKVGLSQAVEQPVYELSGGMQQRVGVARAMATSPAVMLLDEPLGALDAFTRESVQEILLDIWRDSSRMFFFITHDVEEALFLSTRLLIMAPQPGRIVHEFDVPFSRRFAQTRNARAVKAAPDFIEMRERILDLMRQTSSGDLS